ncbi:hypothetical protein HanRHA438_Chr16g0788431 [Helianthus annuus]|nr:hypothetical protein HanRHA438_Chr16g0788431 [Helianthus annuus]
MSMVGAIKKAKPSPGVPLTGNMLTRKEVLKEATVELEVESPSQSLKRRLNMIRPDWLWRSYTAMLLPVSGVTCRASWLTLASFWKASSELALSSKDLLKVW